MADMIKNQVRTALLEVYSTVRDIRGHVETSNTKAPMQLARVSDVHV